MKMAAGRKESFKQATEIFYILAEFQPRFYPEG